MGFLENSVLGLSAIGGMYSANQSGAINKRNLGFQKWAMSNAHQLEVQDLKKAGLNPILSAGASRGAQPQGGSSVPIPNPMAQLPDALRAQTTGAQIDNLQADTDKKHSEKAYTDIAAGTKTAETAKIEEETRKIGQEIKNLRAVALDTINRSKKTKADARIKQLATTLAEVDQAIYAGKYGTAIRLLEKPGLAGTASMLGYSIAGYAKALKTLKMQKHAIDTKAATEAAKINRNRRKIRNRRRKVTRSKK